MSETVTSAAQFEAARLDVMRVADGESTGNQAVDAAVQAVRNAANLPVAEQFATYEAAHDTLREVLASIEE